MELYFDEQLLGIITPEGVDDFWQLGSLSANSNVDRFRAVLEFLVDESDNKVALPEFEELVFGEHWSIVDDSGRKRQIEAPSIYADGEIRWQWSE